MIDYGQGDPSIQNGGLMSQERYIEMGPVPGAPAPAAADLPADRVAARLAEIRGRIERSRQAIDLYGRDVALGEQLVLTLEVPVLLAAVEAVLKLAEPPAETDLDIDGYPEGRVTHYVTCDRLRKIIYRELLGQEDVQFMRGKCPKSPDGAHKTVTVTTQSAHGEEKEQVCIFCDKRIKIK